MMFDGTWKIRIATPIDQQHVELEITQRHDGHLVGRATQGQETVPFLEPVIEGTRMTWVQQVTKPLKLTLKFDVTVDGDTMTGTAKAGLLPTSKLTGSRQ